jgi:predicted RNA-binding Zn-ribbon protein involved in translation (DUF1610 family)
LFLGIEKLIVKKKIEKWIKICPRCGSRDVKGGPLYGMGVFPKPYKCLNCGFVGFLFPEINSKKSKLKA